MKDPIHGNTIKWTFVDGPTKGKAFEHTFATSGKVSYRMADSDKVTTESSYEVAPISDDVFAVAYLASSGWTLTSILDFKSGRITSFASNDTKLVQQHGTFEVVAKKAA